MSCSLLLVYKYTPPICSMKTTMQKAAQKMDNSLFLLTPNMSIGLINPIEHIIDPDEGFDLMCSNYDHRLDDFMLFESCLIDAELHEVRGAALHSDHHQGTVNGGSYVDELRSIHGHSLHVEDEALLSEDDQKDNHIDEGDSSPVIARTRRDRSKTLVAERKRRVRMKEKLYELRSLVPNITKMDKASIIADAVVYVKNLQSQARKLVNEISMLEFSSTGNQVVQISHKYAAKSSNSEKTSTLIGSKIEQVHAQGVGEGTFYVNVVGNMGDGVSSSLYSAIDSVSGFNLESSNFSLASEEFTLTLIFKVTGFKEEMNASSIKMLVMSALLKEGFRFEKTAMLLDSCS